MKPVVHSSFSKVFFVSIEKLVFDEDVVPHHFSFPSVGWPLRQAVRHVVDDLVARRLTAALSDQRLVGRHLTDDVSGALDAVVLCPN